MKKYTQISLFIANCLFLATAIASPKCQSVFTIGAYDEPFAKGATVTKLGPLSPENVPPMLPKTFLEKDGSYAGGEAFCTTKQATIALERLLASGVLPKEENWHVYKLDANWNTDTYKLRSNDFRLKHSVRVLPPT